MWLYAKIENIITSPKMTLSFVQTIEPSVNAGRAFNDNLSRFSNLRDSITSKHGDWIIVFTVPRVSIWSVCEIVTVIGATLGNTVTSFFVVKRFSFFNSSNSLCKIVSLSRCISSSISESELEESSLLLSWSWSKSTCTLSVESELLISFGVSFSVVGNIWSRN